MHSDQFLGALVKAIANERSKLKEDLVNLNIQSRYDLGKIQGRIHGLDQAQEIIEQLYQEQDQ